MRRLIVVSLMAAVAALWPSPSLATSGWTPAPSTPWEREAGVLCDFPLHGEAVVDEVRKRVLESYPDGTPKREIYTGDLVVRVTNTATGSSVDADASGTAVIEYRPGGSFAQSSTWYVVGPVLVGFREGGGTLPRGLYVLDGLYAIDFGPTGFKTVTMYAGTTHNLCADLA